MKAFSQTADSTPILPLTDASFSLLSVSELRLLGFMAVSEQMESIIMSPASLPKPSSPSLASPSSSMASKPPSCWLSMSRLSRWELSTII